MSRSLLHLVLRHADGLASPPEAEPDSELLRRFCRTREEAAFAELLRRHGPMIWAACRQSLAENADAEDAFQATFLALIRSARSVRDSRALAGWLHGVAVRAALKIKRSAARRRQREERSARNETDTTIPDSTWDALLAAVHEEVQRLPSSLRTAFVMCELEGVRQPEAAARLGWKPGTLTGRLSRARQLLIDRLSRRGLAPALAGGSLGLGVATAAAVVPHRLIDSAMSLIHAGGAVSPAILKLASEAIPMTAIRTKLAAAVLLAAGGLGAVLFPLANAQQPGGGGPPGARPGGIPIFDRNSGKSASPKPEERPQPGSGGMAPATGPMGSMAMAAGMNAAHPWEYKIVAGGFEAPNGFQLFVDLGKEGWEYAGSFPITKNRLELWRRTHPESIDVVNSEFSSALIFKRSKGGIAFGGMVGNGGGGGFPPPGNPFAAPAGNGLPGASGGDGPPRGSGGGGGSSSGSGVVGGYGGGKYTRPSGNVPSANSALTVMILKNAKASELATVLEKVFPGDVSASAEPRTNSLIIRANEKTLHEVKSLIDQLDVPGKP
ncbi:MAG TPA: sigma-70 family RNA polymerase sigma factor [Urbifossiella sp.]